MANTIKFQKYYVTNGTDKARVFYSHGQIYASPRDAALGAAGALRECVTLYAKDYDRTLGKIFGDRYENNTDTMSDYIDEGHVRIFPGDPLYAAALARCKQ
jgi:hypothetical protein